MCTSTEQFVKLCLMAGQIHHDACQLLAGQDAYGKKVELNAVEARLMLRADLWALEVFHSLRQRIEATAAWERVRPALTEEQTPGDSVEAALNRAADLLT